MKTKTNGKPDGNDKADALVVCESASNECPNYCRHKMPHTALMEQDYSEICTESSLCVVMCKVTKCVSHNARVSGAERTERGIVGG